MLPTSHLRSSRSSSTGSSALIQNTRVLYGDTTLLGASRRAAACSASMSLCRTPYLSCTIKLRRICSLLVSLRAAACTPRRAHLATVVRVEAASHDGIHRLKLAVQLRRRRCARHGPIIAVFAGGRDGHNRRWRGFALVSAHRACMGSTRWGGGCAGDDSPCEDFFVKGGRGGPQESLAVVRRAADDDRQLSAGKDVCDAIGSKGAEALYRLLICGLKVANKMVAHAPRLIWCYFCCGDGQTRVHLRSGTKQ